MARATYSFCRLHAQHAFRVKTVSTRCLQCVAVPRFYLTVQTIDSRCKQKQNKKRIMEKGETDERGLVPRKDGRGCLLNKTHGGSSRVFTHTHEGGGGGGGDTDRQTDTERETTPPPPHGGGGGGGYRQTDRERERQREQCPVFCCSFFLFHSLQFKFIPLRKAKNINANVMDFLWPAHDHDIRLLPPPWRISSSELFRLSSRRGNFVLLLVHDRQYPPLLPPPYLHYHPSPFLCMAKSTW